LKSYDIIGDVHGHANTLEKLLQELGYKKKHGAYSHPSRQAVFVGDIIDKGPKIREALSIVRSMVDSGSAQMVLGNHEVNAIGWQYPDTDGDYLRKRTDENRKQHQETLEAFPDPKEQMANVKWFQTLPLSLDLGGIRVVHAAWNDDFHKEAGKTPYESFSLLYSFSEYLPARERYEVLCKGYETELPDGLTFKDDKGKERKHLRTKWWKGAKGRTYRDLTLNETLPAPEIEVIDPKLPQEDYSGDAPVFFGHYAADPSQLILTTKIACLDYGIFNGSPLYAYRWDGEQTLNADKIVKMPNADPISPPRQSSL